MKKICLEDAFSYDASDFIDWVRQNITEESMELAKIGKSVIRANKVKCKRNNSCKCGCVKHGR